MAIVSLPKGSIQRLGLWDKVCEYKEWNTWISLPDDLLIEFDDKFEKEEDKDKCINHAVVTGIISLSSHDSPNDFEELFQDFVDVHGWRWNGNIDWK